MTAPPCQAVNTPSTPPFPHTRQVPLSIVSNLLPRTCTHPALLHPRDSQARYPDATGNRATSRISAGQQGPVMLAVLIGHRV